MVGSILMAPALPPDARAGTSKKSEKIESAAHQFEALLIAQLMKSAREGAAMGGLGEGEDQSASAVQDMAAEQFAQAIAAKGGFGIADLVIRSLRQKESTSPDLRAPGSPEGATAGVDRSGTGLMIVGR